MKEIRGRKPKRGGWQTLALGPHKGRELPILIAVTAHTVILRLKGTHKELQFPIGRLYILAADAEARAALKAKQDAKEEKRKAKHNGKIRKPRRVSVRRGILALK